MRFVEVGGATEGFAFAHLFPQEQLGTSCWGVGGGESHKTEQNLRHILSQGGGARRSGTGQEGGF